MIVFFFARFGKPCLYLEALARINHISHASCVYSEASIHPSARPSVQFHLLDIVVVYQTFPSAAGPFFWFPPPPLHIAVLLHIYPVFLFQKNMKDPKTKNHLFFYSNSSISLSPCLSD
jgi:hypothetical protein